MLKSYNDFVKEFEQSISSTNKDHSYSGKAENSPDAINSLESNDNDCEDKCETEN